MRTLNEIKDELKLIIKKPLSSLTVAELHHLYKIQGELLVLNFDLFEVIKEMKGEVL